MKLSSKLLNDIIDKITAKELDFLIAVTRFQNDAGIIKGIYYRDICEQIKINKSTFYKILHSLEDKGIIGIDWTTPDKRFQYHWTIKVYKNSFSNEEERREGCIKLNTEFLYSNEFIELNKLEKFLCLQILKRFRYKNHLNNTMVLTYDTLMRWTGRNIYQVKNYIKSIMSIFDIQCLSNKIEIAFKGLCLHMRPNATEEIEHYRGHLLKYVMRAFKVSADNKTIKEILNLFAQYYLLDINLIFTAIIKCIRELGELIPRFIHRNISILRGIEIDGMEIPNFVTVV